MAQVSPNNPSTTRPNPADRVGYYLWGGPGTIRITQVKYFSPRFDEHSMMTCYDYDYLAKAQDLFGITDCWVTYSWGFADKTEEEDRRFILDRLDNFKRLGIRTHAYIQGPNLVFDEFPDKPDWWARDEKGRRIWYYRGRGVCSIHNEEYVDYLVNKIEATHGLGFDGIYIDNVQHGQLGTPTVKEGELPFVFCGDASPAARAAYQAETGLPIPEDFELDLELTRSYLDFRVRSNTAFIKRLADVVHAGGMEFGTNFYDPKFDPTHIYGINLAETAAVQDYVLFENHALPRDDGRKHNGYIDEIVGQVYPDKPVFVVSYDQGVGMAPQFTQNQLDNLFSEAANARFSMCLKGGEFTTDGIWHCLYLDDLQEPRRDKVLPRPEVKQQSDVVAFLLSLDFVRMFLKRYYNPIFRATFEWRILRIILKVVYDSVLK